MIVTTTTQKPKKSKQVKTSKVNPIKIVAQNGQISLGKRFAGKQIQIFEEDENTVVIKTVIAIPESEMWLYKDDNLERIGKSVTWAESTTRRDNFDEILENLDHVTG